MTFWNDKQVQREDLDLKLPQQRQFLNAEKLLKQQLS